MFLFFNHTLTPSQQDDAKESFGVEEFVYLPENLQNLWSNIPCDLEDLIYYLKPFEEFIHLNISEGDFVLIQGDFGACCYIKDVVESIGATPLYATTERKSEEVLEGDKVVKRSVFRHVKFRRYPKK